MNFELKKISVSGIAHAISKAERYRFLNEPEEGESICRDILEVDPQNQVALRILGLCLTDQFGGGGEDRYVEADAIFARLTNEYEREYYRGILQERRAKAQLRAHHPVHAVAGRMEEAMNCFDRAAAIRPAGNDDALLRWNRCARIMNTLPEKDRVMVEFESPDSPPVPDRLRTARAR